jgi:cytoskeletal protein RodZ
MRANSGRRGKVDWTLRFFIISLAVITILCVGSLITVFLIATSSDSSTQNESAKKSLSPTARSDQGQDSEPARSPTGQQPDINPKSDEESIIEKDENIATGVTASSSDASINPTPTTLVQPTDTPLSGVEKALAINLHRLGYTVYGG